MPTLLIELAGPQQAWGSRSRFATRDTERAPTRSGVIGLCAAALGLPRTAPLDRFDALRFGVRVDQPGRVERDFQTARTLDGKTSMPLSHRYFLSDAVFLAALEAADRAPLEEIRAALRAPRFPLYLGRRAFPPAGPIWTEIVEGGLLDALRKAPWRATATHRRRNGDEAGRLEILLDAEPGERADMSLQDVPQSFDPRRRRYGWRDVTLHSADGRRAPTSSATPSAPHHDPMLLVSDEEI